MSWLYFTFRTTWQTFLRIVFNIVTRNLQPFCPPQNCMITFPRIKRFVWGSDISSWKALLHWSASVASNSETYVLLPFLSFTFLHKTWRVFYVLGSLDEHLRGVFYSTLRVMTSSDFCTVHLIFPIFVYLELSGQRHSQSNFNIFLRIFTVRGSSTPMWNHPEQNIPLLRRNLQGKSTIFSTSSCRMLSLMIKNIPHEKNLPVLPFPGHPAPIRYKPRNIWVF